MVVAKEPVDVRAADVLGFVTAQHRARGAENVVRLDGGSGLSAATVRRRLAAVSAFYGYLVTRGDVGSTRTRCLVIWRRVTDVVAGAGSRWCER